MQASDHSCAWMTACPQSISRGKANRAYGIISAVDQICKGLHGQTHRPDIESMIATGLFDECVAGIEAVVAGGTEHLHDVAGCSLFYALRVVLNCRSQPKCEARIRSLASALDFCIEHDFELIKEIGATTAANAASIGEPASTRFKKLCTRSPKIMHQLSLLRFPVQYARSSAGMRAALSFASNSSLWTCL